METTSNSRRSFVKTTAAGLGLLTLPQLLNAQPNTAATKKKVVCFGGHPDDPDPGGAVGGLVDTAVHGDRLGTAERRPGRRGARAEVGRAHEESEHRGRAGLAVFQSAPAPVRRPDGPGRVRGPGVECAEVLPAGADSFPATRPIRAKTARLRFERAGDYADF